MLQMVIVDLAASQKVIGWWLGMEIGAHIVLHGLVPGEGGNIAV